MGGLRERVVLKGVSRRGVWQADSCKSLGGILLAARLIFSRLGFVMRLLDGLMFKPDILLSLFLRSILFDISAAEYTKPVV